jgi:hypothetical protein
MWLSYLLKKNSKREKNSLENQNYMGEINKHHMCCTEKHVWHMREKKITNITSESGV